MNIRRLVTLAVSVVVVLTLVSPAFGQAMLPDPKDVLAKVLQTLAGAGGVTVQCVPKEKTKPEFGDVLRIIVRVDMMDANMQSAIVNLGFRQITGIADEVEYWREFTSKPDDPSPCMTDGELISITMAAGYELKPSGFFRKAQNPGVVGGFNLNFQPSDMMMGVLGTILVILLALRVRRGRQTNPTEGAHDHQVSHH